VLHDTGVGRDPAALQCSGRAVGDATVTIWINDEEARPASGDARLLFVAAIGGTDTGSTVVCRRLGGGDLRYCQDEEEEDRSSHGRT